jgi:NAD(P)-dependent dehydrogenase (short-subunit alcohol dehydrogenase family)
MMLEDRTAVVYGGGGAIGGAVARSLAAAGARVHLVGRSRDRLEKVAGDIGDIGGVAVLDALDESAVADHADIVAAGAGGIDVAVNAVSVPFAHGTPAAELTLEAIMHPIDTLLRANLVTARAVAPHMTARRSGTILMFSSGAARVAVPGSVGYGTACAAVEALTQRLAVELGPSGVRVVCLRPHAVADGPAHGSSAGEVFRRRAAAAGLGIDEWLARWGADVTLLGRLPTVAQVADAAAFLAADGAAAVTGTVVDLTCGNAVRNAAGAVVGLVD